MGDENDAEKWKALLTKLKNEVPELSKATTVDDVIGYIKSYQSQNSDLSEDNDFTREQLVRAKNEIQDLKAEIKTSQARIEKFEKATEKLVLPTDACYKDAYDTLIKHFEEVTRQRDDKELLVSNLNSELEQLKISYDEKYKQGSDNGYYNRRLCNIPGTTTIVLQKKDENGKFGVRFGEKPGIPYLYGSCIVVKAINEKIVNRNLIKVDDYVIEINGHNVQSAVLNDFRTFYGNNPEELELVLKAPSELKDINVTGSSETYVDYGMTLGVYVKSISPTGYASKLEIAENDEIIKINDKELSLKNLKAKLSKPNVNILLRRRYASENAFDPYRSSSGSGDSTSSGSFVKQPSFEGFSQKRTPLESIRGPPIDFKTHPSMVRKQSLLSLSSDKTSLYNASQLSFDTVNELSTNEVTAPVATPLQGIYENIIDVQIRKVGYEFVGWKFTGGNKIGIFVSSVENWSPADSAKIQVGWKLVEMNELRLENVAFYFAMEMIKAFQNDEVIDLKFEKYAEEQYQKIIERKPHDSFYVEALKDFGEKEIIFKKGERLQVTSTVTKGPEAMWTAMREDGNVVSIPTIPSKFANRKKEPVYTVIPDAEASPPTSQRQEKKSTLRRFNFQRLTDKKPVSDMPLYKLLEDVEVTLPHGRET